MKISYNWLKSYVPDIPEPNRLADLFTYHVCEVESVEKQDSGDFLFDLGILPNRAHDLLSHQGVAKELSGLLGIGYKDPTVFYKTPASIPTELKVSIENNACRRYSARIIRNVKIGPSPEWIVKHLESIGQRSINNVVDATNIVMYDSGQPTHAFDLRNISDSNIRITNAQENEELKLVGREGIVATLKETDLVVKTNDTTLALAGVKGGALSGVKDDTTDIIIEVANFDSVSVRKTARRLGLLTDSAKRFENDLSSEQVYRSMFELSALLLELFPEAVFEDVIDVYPHSQEKKILTFSSSYIGKILGCEIPEQEIEKILKNYNYSFTQENDVYTIEVPDLRLDLVGPHDMAEEIGRVYGYDKVIPVLPQRDFIPKENETYLKTLKIRNTLVSDGYREVMTYAFANKGDIEVLASASDKKFLRTNLTDGLKKSFELNKLNGPLLNNSEIKIFEIETVFKKDSEVIHVAYANKKEIKEMTLDEFTQTTPLKDVTFESSEYSDTIKAFKQWSVYPFMTRDIAVWVPEDIKPESLAEIYKEFGAGILQGEPTLFDQFTKEGKTSYAYRLVFQSFDKTLTDDEVNVIMAHITEKIESLGYTVR
jgi:phenylalanyl-tRNA synthetase beta subunit